MANSETYHIDTRQHSNFHQPSLNLTKHMKGAYCLGTEYAFFFFLYYNSTWVYIHTILLAVHLNHGKGCLRPKCFITC